MNTNTNLLDVLTEGRELPEGCDTWAIRTVRPDGSSSHQFVWPLTAGWVGAPGPIAVDNTRPCPDEPGDGICVARSWVGMASAGVPAHTLLLCAVNSADVLGEVYDKLRARRVYVVAVIDGERLLREHGRDANLRGASLNGANLRCAILHGAYLRHADLSDADLRGADLHDANLRGANLSDANLRGANLTGADLRDVNLRAANLRHADLTAADLTGADLTGASLTGASLRSADLSFADLSFADLSFAYLRGANLGVWERDPETGLARAMS